MGNASFTDPTTFAISVIVPGGGGSSGGGGTTPPSGGGGSGGGGGNSSICQQLQSQVNNLNSQMASISQEIQAQEAIDNAAGIDVATDPKILSLNAAWNQLADQYNSVEQQITANGCL